jgi:hypothetical protein
MGEMTRVTTREMTGEMAQEMVAEMTEAIPGGTMPSGTIPGQLRVCITGRSIQDAALELSANRTLEGEPLLILDACRCFEPARLSRCAPHAAGLLHVLRASTSEPLAEIWNRLHEIQRDLQARQILVVGLLDRLYDPDILTREAAHLLGAIKARLEQLAEDGFDITVLCGNQSRDLGTRAHFLSSLCASADTVTRASMPE